MIEESLLKSNFIGKDGFTWWLGRVAPAEVWRDESTRIGTGSENKWAYRCKVRIVGYHSFDENTLSNTDLPWAHILTSAADGAPAMGGFGKIPALIGGESVFGFFLDGDEGQQPVILGTFYKTPSSGNLGNTDNPTGFDAFSGSRGTTLDPGSGSTASATRIKAEVAAGTMNPTPTSTTSGPAFNMSSFSTNLNLNIPVTTDVFSSTSNTTDNTDNVGSVYSQALNLNIDELFSDDQAHVNFYAKFPKVQGDNGCGTNVISQIIDALQSFINLINRLESCVEGFIDPVLNLLYTQVDIDNIACAIAKLIASILKFVLNGVRDNIMVLIGDLFTIFGITLPQPQQPISENASKNIMNVVFCIFENLLDILIDYLCNMLKQLPGATPNIPTCAAEEIVAAAIGKTNELAAFSLADLFSGLDWLTSGISQVEDALQQGLNILNQILSFLTCDSLQCESVSTWDPFGGINFPSSDNWANVLNTLATLGTLSSSLDGSVGYLSVYGSSNTPFPDCRQQQVNPPTQGGLQPSTPGIRFYQCVPPAVTIHGDGTGATAIPVVSRVNGSILTISVTDVGRGYTRPPTVTIVDNSNYGRGAQAGARLDSQGRISSIYIISGGRGYCPPETSIPGLSTSRVAISTNVVIERPGYGYTSGDTIVVGNGCFYSPVVTPRGSIIGIASLTSCNVQFDTPPTLTINTKTGRGAVLYPVLEFIPQFTTDKQPVGIPTNEIIKVVQCI
jgi:hypothetical protein